MSSLQQAKYSHEMIRKMKPTRVRAFAPPTIANVGPGYDMFGVCLDTNGIVGDFVDAERTDDFSGVQLDAIINDPGLDEPNVCVITANEILRASGQHIGIRLKLTKGMRKGTGMGSSAASSVATAIAVNALLKNPFPKDHPVMINAVIAGEATAIRKLRGHADNVLPCLLGGFVFIHNQQTFEYVRFDVPGTIGFVLASPHYELSTADMRDALNGTPYDINKLVEHASRMVMACHKNPTLTISSRSGVKAGLNLYECFDGGVIEKDGGSRDYVLDYILGSIAVYRGLTEGKSSLLGASVMSDDIVTSVRLPFIPGGANMCQNALVAGAFGSCISGSGPSMFSVFEWLGVSEGHALDSRLAISNAMHDTFLTAGLESDILVAQVCNEGARIVFAE